MTKPAEPIHEHLKQHFAQRAISHAILILEICTRLQRVEWLSANLQDLAVVNVRLQR